MKSATGNEERAAVGACQESRGDLRVHARRLTNQGSCHHGNFQEPKFNAPTGNVLSAL
jgi:hypothetical protein